MVVTGVRVPSRPAYTEGCPYEPLAMASLTACDKVREPAAYEPVVWPKANAQIVGSTPTLLAYARDVTRCGRYTYDDQPAPRSP